MKLRLALVLLPLALAACDEQSMKDFRMPWDKPLEAAPPPAPVDPMQTPLVDPAVSPRDVPIEVAGEQAAAATAESETLNTAAFTGRGNEPFWRVDVSGTTAKYSTPENQSGRNVTVRRLVYAGGVEYIGTLDGAPFSVKFSGADCVDSMSGEKFPMTAVLRVGTRSNMGCASPAAAPAEQTADATPPA
ncbi:hypothetical protein FQV27_10915 [Paracoccus aurantiacus]|uniref:Uncharacterized protein n=1 Tax=Paracoccus aurantiacus TaxID=2599412 RepID=A0A5C6S3G0_9RHOB|nr:hypothetical protein [Paracoccus aurantiacus]TXB68500.1 hypothetical protein FQV27_10915 [Paracoccus aurantiacus]